MVELFICKLPGWLTLELRGGPMDGLTVEVDRRCLRPDAIIRMRVAGHAYTGNGPFGGVETHETLTCEDLKDGPEVPG